MESILTSVKKMCGITEEYEAFDMDIIMHINSVFMILTQMGVGPAEGFFIEDKDSLWTEFIPESTKLQAVKSYMYLKVRMMFDPSNSGTISERYQQLINELEWRLNVQVDPSEL